MSNKWFIDSYNDAVKNRAFYQNNTRGITEKLAKVLDPYGFMDFQSITGVSGPGNYVCVYWTEGDAYVACVNHKFEILWNHSCGGTDVKEEKQRGYILETKEIPEPGDKAFTEAGCGVGLIQYITNSDNVCVVFEQGKTDLPDHFVDVKDMTWNKEKQYWYYTVYEPD